MEMRDDNKLIKAVGVGIIAAAAYLWVSEEPNKRKIQRWLADIEEPLHDLSPLLSKYFLPENKPTNFNSVT